MVQAKKQESLERAEMFFMNKFSKAYKVGYDEINKYCRQGMLEKMWAVDPLMAGEIAKAERELELIWQMAEDLPGHANDNKRDELLAHFKTRLARLVYLWKRLSEELYDG